MKKILFAALVALTACGGPKIDYKAEMERIGNEFTAILSDTTLSEQAIMDKAGEYLLGEYEKHKKDSIGLELFTPIIVNFVDESKAVEMYDNASSLIKEDEGISNRINAIRKASEVAPGNKCKEVVGVDALSGEQAKLSSFFGGEKPLIVDFWASWCAPCRREIANNLIPLYQSGKVNIVGIAVWEKDVEDTKGAMSDLGVTWPVIFSGDRENSPTVEFGVVGIPTLFLLAPDGTILAKGHSIEEFADKL